MSKIKNAELEEKALDVATQILECIQKELLCDTCCDNDAGCAIDYKKIEKLSKVYQTLKPYF